MMSGMMPGMMPRIDATHRCPSKSISASPIREMELHCAARLNRTEDHFQFVRPLVIGLSAFARKLSFLS